MSTTGHPPAATSEHSVARDAVVLGLVYFVLAVVAIHWSKQPGGALTNVWFANAAAIAMLASSRRSRWPVLVSSMVLANIAANAIYRDSLALMVGGAPADVVEALAAAWLLQRHELWRRFDHDLPAYVRMLAFGAVLPELLGATLGALTMYWNGVTTFSSGWLDWYVGSVLGATTVLPLALMLRQMESLQAWRQLTAPWTLILLVNTVGFGVLALNKLPYPLVYLSLPLIASAFLGTPLAALALCFVAVITVIATMAYGVRWPVPAADLQHVLLFLPLIAVVIPAQLLALLMERRRILVETLTVLNSVSTDIAAFCDRQGVMRRVNRAYEHYMLRSSDSVLGRPMEEIVPAHMLPDVNRAFARAVTGEHIRLRAEVDYPGPGKRMMDLSYDPAHGPGGEIVGVIFAAHDVTDLVHAHADLERTVGELTERTRALSEAKVRAESADRIKSAFLATMSHELRTPLNSIIGFTGIILQRLAGPLSDEQAKQLGMVRASARHLLTLINDVLDISKIEAGQLEVTRAPYDIRVSIGKVVDIVRPLADRKGLALEIRIGTDVGELQGDARRVEQVLLNLLGNAIKFTARGTVTLEVSLITDFRPDAVTAADPAVHLRIADTGIGIKAEDMSQLFIPFRQVDSTLSRGHEGTGLGLAICKRLVSLMDGTIAAESVWQQGSVFSVTLPLIPRDTGASP